MYLQMINWLGQILGRKNISLWIHLEGVGLLQENWVNWNGQSDRNHMSINGACGILLSKV
jgi:hypothetical protein